MKAASAAGSVTIGALLFLVLSPAAPAHCKSLHWESIEVDARLDADGVLHVRERQVMVFSGAWNGGWRAFDMRPWQEVKLNSITRIDQPGAGRSSRVTIRSTRVPCRTQPSTAVTGSTGMLTARKPSGMTMASPRPSSGEASLKGSTGSFAWIDWSTPRPTTSSADRA